MGTKIEWSDETWNPVLGCSRVSPGCDGCYAIPGAHMRASNPNPKIAKAFAGLTVNTGERLDWTGRVNLLEERLAQPLRWRNPRRIFINSMSDLFHADVHEGFIVDVFAVMALTPQHTYQLLSKRPGRMRSLLNRPDFWYQVGRKARHLGYAYDSAANHLGDGRNIYDTAVWETLRFLPNVWLGVSVEDQKRADLRIPALLDSPAAIRFLSCEPLLGPIDLRRISRPSGQQPEMVLDVVGQRYGVPGRWQAPMSHRIDWVIVGGESGPGARPMHPDWARSLRDQCVTAFFFKQWGEWGPAPFVVRVCDPAVGWQGTPEELEAAKLDAEAIGATHVHTGHWGEEDGERKYWPPHEIDHKPWSLERIGLPDGMEPIRRWGKKAAGRELDGRTWDQYPEATP